MKTVEQYDAEIKRTDHFMVGLIAVIALIVIGTVAWAVYDSYHRPFRPGCKTHESHYFIQVGNVLVPATSIVHDSDCPNHLNP